MSDAHAQFERFPEAMLAEAAPLALGWSRELCRYVNHSGHSCAANHGLWQYLRLLGLNTALFADAEFYRDALVPAIRSGARRVLVSGCADYAMAAVVLWIFAGEGVRPELTVLDICETPLRLADWYARREGAALDTITCDIRDHRSERPYDIIVTHSFFGLFAPADRPAVVARWHDLLVPGGLLATVNRIRRGAGVIERFSPNQARDFRERVVREAAAPEGRPDLGLSLDELAALADAYAAHNVVYPLHSLTEFAALLEGGDFAVESLAVRTNPAGSRLAGPTMAGNARYAQLRASRP